MWDLPGPGLEPVSPALAGGFLTNCTTREDLFSLKSMIFQHTLASFAFVDLLRTPVSQERLTVLCNTEEHSELGSAE